MKIKKHILHKRMSAQNTAAISTAAELLDFAAGVNSGNNTMNAVLTRNIDMTGST